MPSCLSYIDRDFLKKNLGADCRALKAPKLAGGLSLNLKFNQTGQAYAEIRCENAG